MLVARTKQLHPEAHQRVRALVDQETPEHGPHFLGVAEGSRQPVAGLFDIFSVMFARR